MPNKQAGSAPDKRGDARVARLLRKARTDRGQTIRQLAREIEYSSTHVAELEHAKRALTPSVRDAYRGIAPDTVDEIEALPNLPPPSRSRRRPKQTGLELALAGITPPVPAWPAGPISQAIKDICKELTRTRRRHRADDCRGLSIVATTSGPLMAALDGSEGSAGDLRPMLRTFSELIGEGASISHIWGAVDDGRKRLAMTASALELLTSLPELVVRAGPHDPRPLGVTGSVPGYAPRLGPVTEALDIIVVWAGDDPPRPMGAIIALPGIGTDGKPAVGVVPIGPQRCMDGLLRYADYVRARATGFIEWVPGRDRTDAWSESWEKLLLDEGSEVGDFWAVQAGVLTIAMSVATARAAFPGNRYKLWRERHAAFEKSLNANASFQQIVSSEFFSTLAQGRWMISGPWQRLRKRERLDALTHLGELLAKYPDQIKLTVAPQTDLPHGVAWMVREPFDPASAPRLFGYCFGDDPTPNRRDDFYPVNFLVEDALVARELKARFRALQGLARKHRLDASTLIDEAVAHVRSLLRDSVDAGEVEEGTAAGA